MHFGDMQIGAPARAVRAIENLKTGAVHTVEWGGVRLAIDPQDDPAPIFRCLV
jgi:starch synthase (maltosyl-transferring)